VRIERGTTGQEADGPLTPWKEVGSRGLDTWSELPAAGYAIRDGFGGEPGGSYDYSPLVEDYLAVLEGAEAHEGCFAWFKYALTRLRGREDG